jgi:hypothetical protein
VDGANEGCWSLGRPEYKWCARASGVKVTAARTAPGNNGRCGREGKGRHGQDLRHDSGRDGTRGQSREYILGLGKGRGEGRTKERDRFFLEAAVGEGGVVLTMMMDADAVVLVVSVEQGVGRAKVPAGTKYNLRASLSLSLCVRDEGPVPARVVAASLRAEQKLKCVCNQGAMTRRKERRVCFFAGDQR